MKNNTDLDLDKMAREIEASLTRQLWEGSYTTTNEDNVYTTDTDIKRAYEAIKKAKTIYYVTVDYVDKDEAIKVDLKPKKDRFGFSVTPGLIVLAGIILNRDSIVTWQYQDLSRKLEKIKEAIGGIDHFLMFHPDNFLDIKAEADKQGYFLQDITRLPSGGNDV